MSFTELWDIAWKIGAAFGGIAIGIGAFVRLTSKDSRQEKSEMIAASETVQKFWQTQAENYQVMMGKKEEAHMAEVKTITAQFHEKFNQLSERFGVLQGQYNAEKDARLRAEEILKDRNPEAEKFMTNTVIALGEIMEFMKKINKHMEEENKKELHIDAQITKSTP